MLVKVLDNEKISSFQFLLLVTMFIIGTSILLAPSLLTKEAKQDAWISGIIGTIVGLLVVWLYNTLGKKFHDMTLIDYSQIVFGKWIGKLISLLFLTVPFTLAAMILRNIGDFLTTQIFSETPIEVIHIIFMCLVVMGTLLGIETIARSAEILFPWFLLLFIFFIMFISPEIQFKNIQPTFENGIKPILKAAIPFIGFPFLEMVILLMIFPYVNRKEEAEKAFLMGTFVGGSIIIVLTLLSILVLGTDSTTRHLYPTYELAKKINIADFLQRIEAIVAGMWFITIFFKLVICFYSVALGTAQLLNLQGFKPLTFPLGIILIIYSLHIAPNIVFNMTVIPKVWTPYLIIFGLAFPLLLLGISKLRKKRDIGIG